MNRNSRVTELRKGVAKGSKPSSIICQLCDVSKLLNLFDSTYPSTSASGNSTNTHILDEEAPLLQKDWPKGEYE